MISRELLLILVASAGTWHLASPAWADGEVDVTAERDTGITEDPNLDHAFLMPTAITQPRGAWKVSDTEVLFLGLSYGVTDDFTVTAGAMPPLDGAYTGWLTGKYRFVQAGRFSLAVHGSTALFHQSAHDDEFDFDEEVPAETDAWHTLGLAGSFCVDEACRSVLGAYGGALFGAAFGLNDEDSRFGMLGASAIIHLSGPVKAMVEAGQGAQFNWAGNDDGALLWYGVRIAGRAVAADLGVLEGLGDDVYNDGSIQLGRVPWFKIAYRP